MPRIFGEPPNDFLTAYLSYTNEQESPEAFHIWIALSAIGTVLRRRVFYDYRYFKIYPNTYILLTSPAGKCKKSTAMRMGRELFLSIPGIEVTADSTSRERLIQDFSMSHKDGQSALTAHANEFGSFFSTSGMEMVVFLTDIFDCPIEWSHKTKSGGTNTIKAPYLNVLAGTTPDWLAKAMPLDTIGIGLTSRIILVYHETPRVRDPFPELSENQIALYQLLREDLAYIAANISGEYHFAGWQDKTDAYAAYTEWYKQRAYESAAYDPRMSGYFERKPVHVVKVCMLLAASRRDDLIITQQDFLDTLSLFKSIEEFMPKAFANVGRNPMASDYNDICIAIGVSPGGLSKGELLNRFKYNLRTADLEEILALLINTNAIMLVDGSYRVIIPSSHEQSE